MRKEDSDARQSGLGRTSGSRIVADRQIIKEQEIPASAKESGLRFRLERWRRPKPDELELLAAYDTDAFGETGLRSYDFGVVARAGGLFVATVDEAVAGCCQLVRTYEDAELFWIVGFWVRPKWQGRGLGKAFLEEVIRLLPEARGRGLVLTVSPANLPARRLYAALGFREVERVEGFYGPGEDRLVLEFELTDGWGAASAGE